MFDFFKKFFSGDTETTLNESAQQAEERVVVDAGGGTENAGHVESQPDEKSHRPEQLSRNRTTHVPTVRG